MNADKLREGLFDLTHLEINTIIKSDMTAARITNSPRILLYEISKIYHFELVTQGFKYSAYYADYANKNDLFRVGYPKKDDSGNVIESTGSGYDSFKSIGARANASKKWLTDNKSQINEISEDDIMEDVMLLERISSNCNEIRGILKRHQEKDVSGNVKDPFDEHNEMEKFRRIKEKKERLHKDLIIDMDELLSLKKMNDIGTEKILTQTIIGIDGDVTTRISKTFAHNPIPYINEIHQEAITLSVNYWSSLINVFTNFVSKLTK